ncbi:hypothetical protein DL766_008320 [Monosporascus sp. MC13-8B]|uniref:FAD-binding FR-type domain-containing protein n=1 Tax=Monosporascus cannonballus TaxID=155416 RepID=A0ABY0GYT9_9PEZI|nr:hypothetical protein DL762_007860 [Monosporascus cannonballus]RYO82403.1 hypothetical protein DL763_008254 [Monosporascus cannonballus]RYP19966.1 hypothetical protein DL766_008320 [Monosporascus sp. MC13-8B]
MMRNLPLLRFLTIGCAIWAADAEASRRAPLEAPCFEACQWTLRPIRFNDSAGTSPSPRVRACESLLDLTSLYLCAAAYCTAGERTAGLDYLNATCQTSVRSPIPPWNDVVANDTDGYIMRVRRLMQAEWEDAATFAEPVIPSDAFFGLAFDTLSIYLGGPGEDSAPAASDARSQSRLSIWLRRHVTLPATFGYRNAQPFGWYTVPPRIQTITILAFTIMNIVFCAHGYRVFPGNLYFPRVFTQSWRYVSDRTGIISFANFPLIWLFGMRNNVVMWLTGWDFATYNSFHRWVARIAAVEAVIHSVGYTALVYDLLAAHVVDYWRNSKAPFAYKATVRAHKSIGNDSHVPIATSITLLDAPERLRDVPDYTHWLIRHRASYYVGARYDLLVWVCCCIWVFDRVLRMSRTLAFNLTFWNTKAKATYDKDANIVRLSVPCGTSLYRPGPGTSYYLHMLNDVRFWESHPFTVASVRTLRGPDTTKDTRQGCEAAEEGTALLPRTTPNGNGPRPVSEQGGPHRAAPTMDFLIRPYDSSTRRLARAAAASPPHPASLRVIVEGPYGRTKPLHRFESVLFVVGGSGIVVLLSYLEALGGSATSRTRRVRVVWAVREASFAASVLREDLRASYGGLDLSLDVYVTRGDGEGGDSGRLAETTKQFRVLCGRPYVCGEIEGAMRELGHHGSLAVVACGPARMADDARKAVVDTLRRGRAKIEYFEESFHW